MAELQRLYPARKGCYTAKDLKCLATSLGFPSSLFVEAFGSREEEKHRLEKGLTVEEKSIMKLLDSKVLDDKLDKVLNVYSSKYNVKLVKKATSLLRHKQMTFSGISGARVAFEAHACVDGSGLLSDVEMVMQALRLVERVMAPSRLSSEILKKQLASEIPSRFQMYEFFAIVALCHRVSDIETEMQLEESSMLVSDNSEFDLPNFEAILMTDHQKVLAYLDHKYKASIFKQVEGAPAVLDREHIVSPASRRELSVSAYQQYCTLAPALEQSQTQLNQARNGFSMLTGKQQERICSRLASRESPVPRSGHSVVPDPLVVGCQEESHFSPLQKPVMLRLRRRTRTAGNNCVRRSDVNALTGSTEQSVCREQKELVDTLAEVCVPSVMRARAVVKSSLAGLPQLFDTPTEYSSPPPPSQESPHRPSKSLHYAAIVSQHELQAQQSLIDELQWSSLKRNASRTAVTGTKHKRAKTIPQQRIQRHN